MPYTKEERRAIFKAEIAALANQTEDDGDVNYCLTAFCHTVLKKRGVRYVSINAIIGVLMCAMLELYRRVAAPYEDKKIAENGDVDILFRDGK